MKKIIEHDGSFIVKCDNFFNIRIVPMNNYIDVFYIVKRAENAPYISIRLEDAASFIKAMSMAYFYAKERRN